MEDVGYALGPAFQKHIEAESLSGKRNSRSTVSLVEPPSTYPQTQYQMHPTTVDAILQVCAPALWNGNRTNINAVIIPAIIDDVVVCSQSQTAKMGIAVVTSAYSGVGDPQATKNYTADVDVYDVDTGLLLFRLSKLRTSILNTRAVAYEEPTYCSLKWKPDITFLTQDAIDHLCKRNTDDSSSTDSAIEQVLQLIAFKKPTLRVYEGVTLVDDSGSLWLDTIATMPDVLMAPEKVHFAHVDPKALLDVQDKYQLSNVVDFTLQDITKPRSDKITVENKLDLVIVRTVRHCPVSFNLH